MGPRKNAPKIAHFTRSNGFVPTKHPNSRTPNALKGMGSCFWGFRGHASVQAHTIGVFKGVLDGLGEAADAHDAPFPGSQKGLGLRRIDLEVWDVDWFEVHSPAILAYSLCGIGLICMLRLRPGPATFEPEP